MKIAILLPGNADFGWRWRAGHLARTLLDAGSMADPVSVTIGLCPASEDEWRQQEQELRTACPGVVVRHLVWESVETGMAQRMYPDCRADMEDIARVLLPRDAGWNFIDCDVWLIAGEAGMGAVMPLRPAVYYVRDLAARYVPQAFAAGLESEYWSLQVSAFRMWRQARRVVACDAATIEDLAGYAGVRRERLALAPQLLPASSPATARRGGGERQLLWLTEPSKTHDVTNAMEGLRLFLSEGGGFNAVVAGEHAHAFDPAEGQASLRDVPARVRRVTEVTAFETFNSERGLTRLLNRSDVVWSSAVADGENEGILRAHAAQIPFVGLRYPQSERLAASLGVDATFYDASDPYDIADALALAASKPNQQAAAQPAATLENTVSWPDVVRQARVGI